MMIDRKALHMVMGLVLVALFLSGCGSAPPETRAGEWQGSTDFGEFTILLDPTGTSITQIEYSFESCSSAILSGSVRFEGTLVRKDGEPLAAIEDGKFSVEVSGMTTISFEGKFNSAGTRASGTWVAGACEGKWTSNR